MAWSIEFASLAQEDLRLIFRHLVGVHREQFGHDVLAARDMASDRVNRIMEATARIARAPRIGTRHEFGGLELRHVTLDRAIYWFTIDEDARTVRIEGIFFGGQDHLGRMLARLTRE